MESDFRCLKSAAVLQSLAKSRGPLNWNVRATLLAIPSPVAVSLCSMADIETRSTEKGLCSVQGVRPASVYFLDRLRNDVK